MVDTSTTSAAKKIAEIVYQDEAKMVDRHAAVYLWTREKLYDGTGMTRDDVQLTREWAHNSSARDSLVQQLELGVENDQITIAELAELAVSLEDDDWVTSRLSLT